MAVIYSDVMIVAETPDDVIISAREDDETGRVFVAIRANEGIGHTRVVISCKSSDYQVFVEKIRKALDVVLLERSAASW